MLSKVTSPMIVTVQAGNNFQSFTFGAAMAQGLILPLGVALATKA
jgi:hypothetical protein